MDRTPIMRVISLWSRSACMRLLFVARLCMVGFVAGGILGCGATSDSDAEAPSSSAAISEDVRLKKVDTIRVQEGDSLFIGDFWNACVTTDPFRMYVADDEMHRVAVVGPEGTVRRLIGRRGEGPGEMYSPKTCAVMRDRLIVQERSKYVVFDTSGAYRATHRLPEGLSRGGLWALATHGDHIYTGITSVDLRANGLQAGPDEPAVARFDSTFRNPTLFGAFAPPYTDDAYVWRFRFLDVSPSGTLALAYYLSPEVRLYDVTQPDLPQVGTVQVEHPNYRPVSESIPIQTPRSELMERASNLSFMWHTYVVNDSTLVQTFQNRTMAYYDQQSEDEMSFYAVIADVSGEPTGTVQLDGPMVARDDQGRVYVRRSNRPDRRIIDVYEVQRTAR